MKKYELRKCEREFKYKERHQIKEGCTLSPDGYETELIKAFDNIEEALQELDKLQSSVREMQGNVGMYYLVTEYFVEENEYDEDGEWISGGDIYDFSRSLIGKVVE